MSQAIDDPTLCDYCGALPSEGWLDLEVWREVWREDGKGMPDVLHLGFCDATHAGHYFTEKPLPPPEPWESPGPMTWRDRVGEVLFVAVALTVLLLALVGLLTIGRWILP